MSKISDGIEFALQQSRAARAQKTAEIATPPVEVIPLERVRLGAQIKEAAQVALAGDVEDVTVGDLQALVRTVNQ